MTPRGSSLISLLDIVRQVEHVRIRRLRWTRRSAADRGTDGGGSAARQRRVRALQGLLGQAEEMAREILERGVFDRMLRGALAASRVNGLFP